MKNNKSYYAIIPANVRYSDIPPNAKLLYGEITALSNEKGYCWASNKYFAELYKVNIQAVSLWIKILEENGFIECKRDKDIISKILDKRNSFNNLGIGKKQCEWCGVNTFILHKHHYPILKEKGGKKIVNICPNCHHEFHFSPFKLKLRLSKTRLSELNNLKLKYE